jgi:hypothetical protein
VGRGREPRGEAANAFVRKAPHCASRRPLQPHPGGGSEGGDDVDLASAAREDEGAGSADGERREQKAQGGGHPERAPKQGNQPGQQLAGGGARGGLGGLRLSDGGGGRDRRQPHARRRAQQLARAAGDGQWGGLFGDPPGPGLSVGCGGGCRRGVGCGLGNGGELFVPGPENLDAANRVLGSVALHQTWFGRGGKGISGRLGGRICCRIPQHPDRTPARLQTSCA